jgi:sterol desaturase/sphingolipid hydroxylase (fatty acid hydroxylase superfamily)
MLTLAAVFFGGLLAFHLLERFAGVPVLDGYRTAFRRRGYRADLMAALVNGPALGGATRVGAVGLVLLVPGISDELGAWPWAAQFALFFLVNDFGRYWLHRWYHASPRLWRVHRVHHSTVEMDCLSVIRIHILEAVMKNFLLALPFQALGASASVLVAYSCIDVLKGFWHHANLRTHVGPLNYFLNTAELHWWHHSTERRGNRSNYGSILSIWDWLFGTAYWPQGEWPATIGVKGVDRFPEKYFPQLASIRHDDDDFRSSPAPAEQSPPEPHAAFFPTEDSERDEARDRAPQMSG